MSSKYKDNCWADKIRTHADYEYITDIELDQFLVFDHKHGFLRIYQDADNNNTLKEKKLFKVVKIDSLPQKGIEAILAHPYMTKKIFHYFVIQVAGRVSLLKTSGITTASN